MIDFEAQQQVYTDLDEIHSQLKACIDTAPDGASPMLRDLLERVAQLQDVVAPEQVTAEANPAEDGAPSIGWLMLGDMSVSLTRSMTDGKLVVTLENTGNDATDQKSLEVRVEALSAWSPLWEGKVS